MAKPQRRRQPGRRSKSSGNFLLGMFVGLIFGLAIALGVAFYLNRAQIPFLAKNESGAQTSASTSLPSGASVPANSEKPKFDFYRILAGNGEAPVKVPAPGASTLPATKPPPPPAATSTTPAKPAIGQHAYYVQTGAFEQQTAADSQKAQLALLNLYANIVPSTVPGEGRRYRVRLGPYTRVEEINRVRQRLAQNGFKFSLVNADGADEGN